MPHSPKILLILILYSSSALSQPASASADLYARAESIAKKDVKKAFPFFEKSIIASKNSGDFETYVTALNRLSELAPQFAQEQFYKIINYVKQGASIVGGQDQSLAIADLHFNNGVFYHYFSTLMDSAINQYQLAREIRSKLLGEVSEPVAKCYYQAGLVFNFYTNEFLLAEQNFEKALQIREHLDHTEKSVLASTYYSLAANNRSQRDFEKAIAYGLKALETVQESGDQKLLERTYTLVANIYRDNSQSKIAKEFYLKAILLNLKTKNSQEVLAWEYESLGETYMIDSMYNEAVLSFEKARAIYEKIPIDFQPLMIHCLQKMADTYLLSDQFSKCHEIYKSLFQILKSQKKFKGRQAAEAFAGKGDYFQKMGQYDSALVCYQNAIKCAVRKFEPLQFENPPEETIGFNYYLHSILNKKSETLNLFFSRTGDEKYLHQSLSSLILSEKLMSLERNSLDIEESKWKYLDANYDVYENILATLYALIEKKKTDSLLKIVFYYVEQSKARTLADVLTNTVWREEMISKDTLFRRQDFFERSIFKVQSSLTQEFEKEKPDDEKVKRFRNEIVQLDGKINKLKFAIEEKYPGYFKIKYANHTQPLNKIQILLKGKNQIIVEYFYGRKDVYGLCISENDMVFKRIGSSDSISNLISAFLRHFSDEPSGMSRASFQFYSNSAFQLYRKLLEPFKVFLADNRRVAIIPDGPIAKIPFDALIQKQNASTFVNYKTLDYLLKHYFIGYSYSTVSLFNGVENSTGDPSMLAMSYSGEGGGDARQFQKIIGTESELQMLSLRLPVGQFLKGNESSEANFKKMAPSYDLIHLAVHGAGNVHMSNTSSLFFNSFNDSIEDNELHSYELYALKLKARLVVLSACESGIGKDYKGEGMLSMASAFAYAGCDNIVLNLWKASDQASISLIDVFYNNLLNNLTMDESLAQAKLNYLEKADELSADPRIWASLVAYGNLEKVIKKERRMMIYSVVAFIGIFIILLYWNRNKIFYRKLFGRISSRR